MTIIKQAIAIVLWALMITLGVKAGASFYENIDIEPLWTIMGYILIGMGVGFICLLIAEWLKISSDK